LPLEGLSLTTQRKELFKCYYYFKQQIPLTDKIYKLQTIQRSMFNTIFTNSGPAIRYCESCKDLYINYTIVPSGNSREFYHPESSPPTKEMQKIWAEETRLERARGLDALRPTKESLKGLDFSSLNPSCLKSMKIDVKPKLKLDLNTFKVDNNGWKV